MFRYLAAAATVAGVLFLAGTAQAQPITYYIQSAPYASVSNATACPPPHTACTTNYTTSQRLSGSFTILNPLAPNLNDEVIDLRLGGLNLNDGQNNFVSDLGDWIVVAQTAQVSTDGSGNLTYFEFKFDLIHGTLPTANNVGDPKSYVSSIWLVHTPGVTYAAAEANSLCTLRGDNVGGNTTHPSAPASPFGCKTQVANTANGASGAFASAVTISLTPPPPVPAPVPTLSEWAMILLGGLLAGGTALHLQRRRQVA